MGFLITSLSGFLALFLILFTLLLPYILRRQMQRGGSQAVAAWQHMKLHYWIGYAVLILVIVHMYASMGAGVVHSTSALGLDLATLGLLLVLIQVALGISLRNARTVVRLRLRRMHFVVMTGVIVTVLAHLALNSALIQILLRD